MECQIVIECKSSDFNYIKKHILESDLSTLLPLEKVDWDYVKEKVYMSLMLVIAEKWNSGINDIDQLGQYIGVKSTYTIKKYIRLAIKYGYISSLATSITLYNHQNERTI